MRARFQLLFISIQRSPTATFTPTPTNSPTTDPGVERIIIGQSAGGTNIEAVRMGNGPNTILFIGGLHAGFAPSSVTVAQRAIDHFSSNPDQIPVDAKLYIIPSANPDSPSDPGNYRGRVNNNNVDLNRNWGCDWKQTAKFRNTPIPGSGGPAPFSEPETRSLRDFLLDLDPVAVIFWEARAINGLSSPGGCGQVSLVSETLAQIYGVAAGYEVEEFSSKTGQELNWDGTNWLDQQRIPSIAVLLPDYITVDWTNNLSGMQAVLRNYGN